jgi:glycerate kinase
VPSWLNDADVDADDAVREAAAVSSPTDGTSVSTLCWDELARNCSLGIGGAGTADDGFGLEVVVTAEDCDAPFETIETAGWDKASLIEGKHVTV